MKLTEPLAKGERLISLDAAIPRGWKLLGELPTDDGPRLHIIFWRRQKRIDHQIDRAIEPRVMDVAEFFFRPPHRPPHGWGGMDRA